MSNSINTSPGRGCGLFLLVFWMGFCILGNQVFSSMPGADSKGQTDELAKIEKTLAEKRKSIEQLSQQEKSVFEELLNLEESLDSAQCYRRLLRVKEKNLEEEFQIEERSSRETDAKLIFCREQFKHRVREIYKHRKSRFYAIIFGASSPVDLVNRLNFVQMILKKDQDILIRTTDLKIDMERNKLTLKNTKEELSELAKKKTAEEIMFQRQVEEKNRLFNQIKSEKTIYVQAVEELEKSAAELENILTKLQPDSSSSLGVEGKEPEWRITYPGDGLFAISKRKLPWPVQGKVISRFGEQVDPRFGTKIKSSGIDIEGAPGKEVVAVAEGRVIYSSRLRGYGNLVILEHDGGYYTLYARLSETLVSLGQAVNRLQTIGILGEGGLSSGPSIHFEIREGKQPQNPLEWLR